MSHTVTITNPSPDLVKRMKKVKRKHALIEKFMRGEISQKRLEMAGIKFILPL